VKLLRYIVLSFLLSACFHTVIPGPDGKSVTVKTPCDREIWVVTRKYGEPTQALVRDNQIRYYYASTRMEYDFGWVSLDGGCSVNKQLHLTVDGII
jgi:hypothetical protein